jgi:hypothetical protein
MESSTSGQQGQGVFGPERQTHLQDLGSLVTPWLSSLAHLPPAQSPPSVILGGQCSGILEPPPVPTCLPRDLTFSLQVRTMTY